MDSHQDLLWLGFEGNQPCKPLERWLATRLPSGLIFFGRNIPDRPAEMRRFLQWIREIYAGRGEPPPFLAIDHEGGKVQRLGSMATRFPPFGKIARLGADAVARVAAQQCRELRNLGFNTLLGPVLDVADPANGRNALEDRTFSGDPAVVELLGRHFLAAARKRQILTCPKHFPGYGSVVVDPHRSLPRVTMEVEEWERTHAPPFRDLPAEDAPFVMLAHLENSAFGHPGLPTSLNPAVTAWLRGPGGYNGLIIPDDLCMGAVTETVPWEQVGPAAIEAGLDLLLLCHPDQPRAGAVDHVIETLLAWDPPESIREKVRQSGTRIRARRSALKTPPIRPRSCLEEGKRLREAIEKELGD